MSAEFRQRKPGELLGIVKRQKWMILLPMFTMTLAIGYVVYRLPAIYESTSLLTVKPPTISPHFIQSLTSEDLSQRLQTINQEVLSRSSLEPMIQKYDLYKEERASGVPVELIVDKLYKNIKVDLEDPSSAKVAAFRIRYRDRDPQAARNVTADLAGKYVSAQMQNSVEIAESTNQLFDRQLAEKKAALDDLEKQRLEIMNQNIETLPESEQGLVSQLQGLRQREDAILKEKQSLYNEKGRLSDAISSNNRQIKLIEDFSNQESEDTARQASDPESTPAYGELVRKRADLNAQLDALSKVYKPKHPAMIAKQSELQRVNDEFENLKKTTEKRVAAATKGISRKTEMQKNSLLLENQRVQSQIGLIEKELGDEDSERERNAVQIQQLEARINAVPNVKVALEGLNSRYQSAKQTYDEILKKKNDAETVVGVETNAQGETIRVQDAANIPQSPVAPKRFLLTLVGAGFGVLLGLLMAGFFEIPRLFRIQNIDDARHYTGLPVLASVPPLLSPAEKDWIRRAYWMKLFAGVAAAIGVIPLIIIFLQVTKLFEKLVS